MAVDPRICIDIVNYLSYQNNQQDNLDGILLGIFAAQYKNLTDQILQNLRELISVGVIEEILDEGKNMAYKLVIPRSESSKYLRKFGKKPDADN